MIKVLIVEDDGFIAKEIKNILIELNFAVTGCVKSVDRAITSIKNSKPDIVLIDIELKGSKNGIFLAKEIDKYFNIPYIYLTSMQDEETILEASFSKYNTYLTKPILNINNLKSNILIEVNKAKQIKETKEFNNGYRYDYESMNLYYNNELILLSSNEKALLNFFINNINEVLSHKKIEDYIWHDNMPYASNSLRNLVYSLRKKSGLNIVTIPTLGYKLIIE